MTKVVELPGGRTASYHVIGDGTPTLMFAGGPGFTAAYMNGDAELFSEVLRAYLVDPHGSGSSTPPPDPARYSPEGHARFYEEVRQALRLPRIVVLGHSFGATTALVYAALFSDAVQARGPSRLSASARRPMPRKEARPGRRLRPCCFATLARRGTRQRARSWTSGLSGSWPPPTRRRWSR
jgi:pimeloyl-ACP methyl ester carboxylesterase